MFPPLAEPEPHKDVVEMGRLPAHLYDVPSSRALEDALRAEDAKAKEEERRKQQMIVEERLPGGVIPGTRRP